MTINRWLQLQMVIDVVAIIGFTTSKQRQPEGVWRIVEVRTFKKDGTSTVVMPKESQVIFSKGYYSLCWSTHESAIAGWQQPDSARLNRMGQMLVNAGGYELKGARLVTRAGFALNPMFVNGVAEFMLDYVGDTLVLKGTNVVSASNIQHPLYASGSYVVNKLVRMK
ncbi:hypothetical protein KJS94_01975 [Flavihumibacter rivuli]|uniref:hypothetical protein n=1 Tax=Flavihumibacter rivuli TaxID=2838156 RepID=UPI001BDDDF77|nr:hypothetical protein [Flavihumibacter rivuli]ULQ56962.1 hypothetical protein KJS94_01975 [Flavihumibacter rivuli]